MEELPCCECSTLTYRRKVVSENGKQETFPICDRCWHGMDKQTIRVLRSFILACQRAEKYLIENPPPESESFEVDLASELDAAIGMAGLIMPKGMTVEKFLGKRSSK